MGMKSLRQQFICCQAIERLANIIVISVQTSFSVSYKRIWPYRQKKTSAEAVVRRTAFSTVSLPLLCSSCVQFATIVEDWIAIEKTWELGVVLTWRGVLRTCACATPFCQASFAFQNHCKGCLFTNLFVCLRRVYWSYCYLKLYSDYFGLKFCQKRIAWNVDVSWIVQIILTP